MAIDCCWLFLGLLLLLLLLLFLGGWPLHYHCSIILDMGVMISQSHWLGVTCHSKLDIWLTNYCVRHSRWLAGWRCGVTLAPPHWLTLITQISCASPAVVGGMLVDGNHIKVLLTLPHLWLLIALAGCWDLSGAFTLLSNTLVYVSWVK